MAANENKAKPEALEIGISKDAGGAIFAGISPNTNQPMYVAPADASMRLGFNAAARYAAELEVGGQKGFRLAAKWSNGKHSLIALAPSKTAQLNGGLGDEERRLFVDDWRCPGKRGGHAREHLRQGCRHSRLPCIRHKRVLL